MAHPSYDMVGLGYCGLDYCCLCPRIPLDDKVKAMETITQGGGPAATATYAAAKLGLRTAFLGVTGDDERGREIRAQLRRVGVDTAHMPARAGAQSPAAFCWADAHTGQRSIVWTSGTAGPLTAAEIDEIMILSARLLHLDGHQTDAAIRAAAIARDNGVTVAIDAGTIVDGIVELLPLAHILIASEKFMLGYTGEQDPELATRILFHPGCRFVAVTLGARGSVGFDGDTMYRQPSFPVEVVDTTGAGDVFHGAFAYRYLTGGGWAECLRFSAAVAALKCTAFGGRTGIPCRKDAEDFLAKQKQIGL